jgi:hypothetical protein
MAPQYSIDARNTKRYLVIPSRPEDVLQTGYSPNYEGRPALNWRNRHYARLGLLWALEIAVGIPLTRYPPRGPGRALISASGSYRG